MKKQVQTQFKKLGFLIFGLLFSSQMLFAQTGSLKGTVTDNARKALPGANIMIEGTELGTASDLSGSFELSDIPVGKQTVKVSFVGYQSTSELVNIVDDKTLEVSFILTEDTHSLESVMVTATRRTTDIQTTPASISAISGKQLEEQGKVDVTQFIDAIPGVTSVSNGSNNRIIFRNIATSTQEAGSAVSATYFDDFPISNPGGGIPTIRMVDMDRVEVLKGPQGTLFGRSAMSGIVRYMPNKPNTKNIEAGINTYTSSTTMGGINFGASGYLNYPISENMAVRAVIYKYNNSGFIDNVELNVPDFNDEKIFGGRFAFHWQPTDKFSVGAIYLKENYQGSYAWVTSTHDPSDPYAHNPINVKDRTRIDGTKQENSPAYDFYNLKLEYDFDFFTSTLLTTHTKNRLGFVYDQREYLDIHEGATFPSENGFDDDNLNNVTNTNVIELRLVSESNKFIDWIAGIYYDDSKTIRNNLITYYGPDMDMFGFYPITDGDVAIDTEYETTNGEIAGYGELGFNFKSNTRVVLGYRYSNIKFSDFQKKLDGFFLDDPVWGEGNMNEGVTFKTEENVSTYKVGIEQKFNEDIFAYVLASSGYRPGGYNEATMNVPFSTFHSDKLWNYELGLKTSWLDGRLRANVAAYMLRYDDIQLNIQDMETFIRATKNVGKAQVLGVEYSLNYFVNENFQMALNGSLSSPELLEDIQPTIIDPAGDPNDPDNLIYTGRAGDKLPGSATESFSFSANYNKPLNDNFEIFANANYKYVGTRLNNFNLDLDVELPAYSLVDFRTGVSHSSGITIALFADNLLDEAITYNIDRIGSFEAAPTNRPRTVGVNVSYALQ